MVADNLGQIHIIDILIMLIGKQVPLSYLLKALIKKTQKMEIVLMKK